MAKKDNSIERKETYNIQIEEAFLSEIISDPNVAEEYVPKLTKDYFFDADNRIVFEVCQDLIRASKSVDLLSVIDRLKLNGKSILNHGDATEYVTSLLDSYISSATVEQHYDILRRDYILRKIADASQEIHKVSSTDDDADDALNRAERIISSISEGLDLKNVIKANQYLGEAVLDIQNAQHGQLDPGIVFTGYKDIDNCLHGLKPGEMIVIGARPGVGKTALGLNIASNVLKKGKKVIFFSLEMSGKAISKRLIASVAKVSQSDMNEKGKLTEYEMNKVMDAFTQFADTDFYIDEDGLNSPSQIFNKCKRKKRELGGLDLVIIDYLQLVNGDDGFKNASRQEIVASVSKKIKAYSKELKVPIIVLAQLRRMGKEGDEVNDEKIPTMSELRESGQIEADADAIMLLHQPKGVDIEAPVQPRLLIIDKNRNGARKKLMLKWEPAYTLYSEYEKELEQEINVEEDLIETEDNDIPF